MRLFVALRLAPPLLSALTAAQDDLRRQGVTGTYTRRENLHLTLAFLGETRDLSGAKAALAGLTVRPFPLTLSGAGSFDDTLWAGTADSTPLYRLAEEVQTRLRQQGFRLEDRAFRPHITLVRRAKGTPQLTVPRRTMTVAEVSLMQSERVRGTLTYTEVWKVRL